LLARMRALLGREARLILGADMVKDAATLIAAYDDAAGVTAEFNRNVLRRINRELGGNFDLKAFDHLALWNDQESRMEMHLVSRHDQIVHAAGRSFGFTAGERLHTENSYKFTEASVAALARDTGWVVEASWISPPPAFGVFRLA